MTVAQRSDRREQILQVLAAELESKPGSRITTAALARAVGVSEAALYRHFPSKAKMFEALIEFAEQSVFGLISRILEEQDSAERRCEQILKLLLGFSARNPGITRVLLGDALVGEHERLRIRVSQFFDRLETQLRQILREATTGNELRVRGESNEAASLLMAFVEGRMSQFTRSGFQSAPDEYWEHHWGSLRSVLFN